MVDRVQRGVKAGLEEARRDADVPDEEPRPRRGRGAREH